MAQTINNGEAGSSVRSKYNTMVSEVNANNAKETNATHTGDATGDEALTVVALRNKALAAAVASPSDGDILVFRSSGDNWVLEAKPAGGSGSSTLEDLTDISITSVGTGELLQWNGSNWVNRTITELGLVEDGHSHTADDITDFATEVASNSAVVANTAKVSNATHTRDATGDTDLTVVGLRGKDLASTLSSPSDGDILVFRSSGDSWVLEAKPAGGSNPAMADITDVTVTSIGSGEVLMWNGTAWIDRTLTELGAAATDHDHVANDITDFAAAVAASASVSANTSKLSGIENNATADQSDSEIETAYNNQVAQVSSGEITAGTETGIRRFSPADVKGFVEEHGGGNPAWGDIAGTLSNQTDLNNALGGKADSSHTHTASEITDFDTEVTNNTTVAANASKLAGIEAGATGDQTDGEIETLYNSAVAQVSSGEINAGTETGIRRYSPADIKSFVATHAPTGSATVINLISGQDTLELGDAEEIMLSSGSSPVTLTIPTNASVAFTVGTQIMVLQTGTGLVTVEGDTGVTVNGVSAGSVDSQGQYYAMGLIKTSTNTWVVIGGDMS